MGFETQEEAERWAENMEFRADQLKEERLLASQKSSDAETLDVLAQTVASGVHKPLQALKAAYALGKLAGMAEMARIDAKR